MNTDSQELARHTPRKDIQGLRALAVLVVVAFHAGLPMPGGFIGVDVFFVISGFVITAMLMRQRARDGRLSFTDFYSRRLRRLLPALALMVSVVLVGTALLGAPFNGQQEVTALTGAGAVLAVANVVLALRSGGYFVTPPTANPLLNTWSLSVEEQFYLVFPFVLAGLWWAWRRRSTQDVQRGLLVAVGVLAVASFALSWVMSTDRWGYRLSDPAVFAFYSAPTRAWEFAAGAILALGSVGLRLNGRLAAGLQALGVLGIVASAFLITEATPFPGLIALVPVGATVLALLGGSGARGPVASTLSNPVAVKLGDLSYSWYLWHWPLIAFAVLLWPSSDAGPVLASAVALALAWGAFRFVENPLRFDTRLRGRRLLLMVGVCLGVSLGLAALVIAGARQLWWNDGISQMNAQVSAPHAWLTDECNSAAPLGTRDPSCTLNGGMTGAAVYLVGDSQAGMLTEGMALAMAEQGRPVSLGTKGGCPFIDATMIVDGGPDTACRSFVNESVAWLETQEPGTVVIGNWAAYMWLQGLGLQRDGEEAAYEPEDKMTAFAHALESTVGRLEAAGHQVLLLQPIPAFPEPTPSWGGIWYPYQCSTVAAMISVDSCGASLSRQETERGLQPYTDVFTSVADRTGAGVIDLTGALCPDGVCRTNAGNTWAYLDGQHISVGESERLAPLLATIG